MPLLLPLIWASASEIDLYYLGLAIGAEIAIVDLSKGYGIEITL